MPRITAIVITRNEERGIARCLASLGWADEIILVDALSTDRTVEIARTFACRILSAPWQGFARAKEIAIEAASHDWIFWLDADETVPEALRDEVLALDSFDRYDAWDMPRQSLFLGTWIKHGGWYPGRVKRLFHKHHTHMGPQILHEGIEMDRPHRLGHLRQDLLHYAYESLHQYFAKMNDYGLDGARELRRRGIRFAWWRLLLHPTGAFVKTYFVQQGWRDGPWGFIISVGSAYSNFIKYTNLYLLSREE